ncbi:cation efflux protein [Artomyces pyxidatus]|uniref:Cation efflux protein n=1 Tax=Artomyces pyxidatus TaxID=48021 RepID=A0ACB8T639_9AGAM|nr:cation efflux protein [Artomyces pyxidatus]
MVISERRVHSNGAADKGKEPEHSGNGDAHGHANGDHHHSHSHGIFGHTHAHGEDGHDHGGQLLETLQKSSDRGSRITLIGLGSNVLLTSAKGAAGVYMNSAALLADAGHSLSDLLGDFVVLFSWRLSRRPPSARYPYGLAKFETAGTTIVALLLIGGALGIGVHSLSLLLPALSDIVSTLPAGPLQTFLESITHVAHKLPVAGHEHVLDPNAAWFAAASVATKEWLFRITRKVADEERSPVLLANAYHHRSDAYSSVVALVAILGSSWFPALPLDPIGGFLVSIVILRQGFSIFSGAFRELTDAGASPATLRTLSQALHTLTPQASTTTPASSSSYILGFHELRARRAGSQLFVDFTASVPGTLSVGRLTELEHRIEDVLKTARKDVKEVRVRYKVAGKIEAKSQKHHH